MGWIFGGKVAIQHALCRYTVISVAKKRVFRRHRFTLSTRRVLSHSLGSENIACSKTRKVETRDTNSVATFVCPTKS